MRWGLMGGTFDPIHLAHLRCAQEILEDCNLDKIVFIPSATPPLKHGPGITPYEHRERMVRLAVEGNPDFAFSDVENRRRGRSYTVDTIGYFRKTFGKELEIFFILGQDAFDDIRRWKDWRRLLTLCHFIVLSRPGWRRAALRRALPAEDAARFAYDRKAGAYRSPSGTMVAFAQVTALAIGATDIRERVRQGRSIRYLVPDAVREYIERHGLYKQVPGDR
ncbi:MAG: nicotinate-nucleotide adenylyltransferase [Syntrophobacterales bacterium]|nr:nicotinate-nucleotide adenylyltransferase [Syntrophobacterales bacterium]HNS54357.1 nicotinate-nucleotide adenylyltransferase [Syntrophales bacterium]